MTDESQAQTSDQKVIGDDVAEVEFKRFVRGLRAKEPAKDAPAKAVKDYQQHKQVFLDAVKSGSLKVDERGQPLFTPRWTQYANAPIPMRRPTGATLIASDGVDDTDKGMKALRMLAQMTGHNVVDLEALDMDDLAVLMAIQSLLF